MFRLNKLFLLLIFVVTPVLGAEDILQICAAGGYYSGAQDRFMSGVAMHILQKKGVLGKSTCSAIWKNAYDVGSSFSRTGKYENEADAEVVRQAGDFSTKVYSAITKNMGF